MMKQKVGLLFGGCSGEHEVSITSARAIASALEQGDNKNKYDILPVYYVAVNRSQVYSSPCVFPKLCDEIEAQLDHPYLVKPSNLGSSVRIAKVRSCQELEEALNNATANKK
jgi:D-alanine-D-alanine ligase-like ATP-grasp enzyme